VNTIEPGIYLDSADGVRFSVLLAGATTLEQLPAVTPEKDLLAAVSIDYTDYRREIRRLRDEHPLFEPKLDIPVAELEDLAGEALLLPSMLSERDPVSYFALGWQLDQCLRMKDDGSASFLLHAGQALIRTLEIPIRTQNRLRNIFEMAFDDAEITEPLAQLEKLRGVYPEIAQACTPPAEGIPTGMPLTFQVFSSYGLRLLELMLYFRQNGKRINRCEHCWEYFIPPTKKVTRYCDRVYDGQSCKQRGANLMRREKKAQSNITLIYRRLRDRMQARAVRYDDAGPEQQSRLIQFDGDQYAEWSELASRMRLAYIKGEISAGEFLRTIDIMHELDSYDVEECKLPLEKSRWQKLVAGNPDFDPELQFPSEIMSLKFSAENPNPEWKILTSQQIRERVQKSHMSLQAKYRNDKKQD